MAAARKRLVTEFTRADKTADLIWGGIEVGIEAGGDASPLADLTAKQAAALAGMVLFILGEVYERQFYPSDREQCQEVGREVLSRAGLPVPPSVVIP